jgi:hypothetical protein
LEEVDMSLLPIVIGAVFCVIGAGLGLGGFSAVRKARKRAAWPTVAGSILSTDVVEHRRSVSGKHGSRKSVSYEPIIKYSYSVDGKNYSGKRIAAASENMISKRAAEKRIGKFSSGTEILIHYDPKDPKQAVLDTRAVNLAMLFGIGAAMIALGVLTLAYASAISELFSF